MKNGFDHLESSLYSWLGRAIRDPVVVNLWQGLVIDKALGKNR